MSKEFKEFILHPSQTSYGHQTCAQCGGSYRGCSNVPLWCDDCIVAQPEVWHLLCNRARQNYNNFSYLVTFTRNPNSRYTQPEWFQKVMKELSKKFTLHAKAELEHITTNIHCHAVIECTKAISKTQYSVFNRDYGYVDLRRVKVDNGIDNYICKDLPAGMELLNVTELREKYKNLGTT